LSVLNINIPPLRDRKDDIPLLVSFNVAKYNKVFNKNIKYVSNKMYDKLRDYDWPGNVRELENVIIHGISVVDKSKEKLEFKDIEGKYNELIQFNSDIKFEIEPLAEMVNNYERCIIDKTLKHVEYNVTKASKLLNIPRQTLQRKAKQYNLI